MDSHLIKNTFIINEVSVDIKALFVAFNVVPIDVAEGADLYAVFVVIVHEGAGGHGLGDADGADDVAQLAA